VNSTSIKIELISDFNLQTVANYLENSESRPEVAVHVAPFGQVVPTLLQANDVDPSKSERSAVAVIWTAPAAIIPAFADAVQSKPVRQEAMLGEVREFARHIITAKDRFRSVLVCAWTLPRWQRGLGLLDLQKPSGLRNLLLKMNLELISMLQDIPGVYILNPQDWIEAAGKTANSPKSWYLTKTPYGAEVLKQAAVEIKSALRTIAGETRKLIVVDLDDTMWGGVVGDIGWENLRIGGHDHAGEAFVDFQRALKSLRNRGILLAIASKNTESVALQALRQHPEMMLRPEDFACWRINWQDKAANIIEIAAELRLGLQSVVFIDDNPVERARVREALPEVLVPDWPNDKTLAASSLLALECFDSAQITNEDQARAGMYADEHKRDELKSEMPTVEHWLSSLQTKVSVEELNSSNRARVAQLFNKTNQMNLTTRRMSESELVDWANHGNRKVLAFRVQDRFGDSGLTGILTLDFNGETATIADHILSCRVMGRRVEETMLAVAAEYSARAGSEKLIAEFIPTAKNKPCHEFWMRSGFTHDAAGHIFTWDMAKPYARPATVELVFAQDAANSEEKTNLALNPAIEPAVIS
jgi:FkbH-like protein